MKSSNPKEFVSLHNNHLMDNFSEIYPRRLIVPYKCQNATSDNEHCKEKTKKCIKKRTKCFGEDCISDHTATSGFTAWKKISIDLNSMTIDRFDFTFTEQIYGDPVPFATAGDCYSIASCPMGRFSVNLQKTGLILHKNVDWVSEGHFSHQIIKKQVWFMFFICIIAIKVKLILKLSQGTSAHGRCGGYCGKCFPEKLEVSLAPESLPQPFISSTEL